MPAAALLAVRKQGLPQPERSMQSAIKGLDSV